MLLGLRDKLESQLKEKGIPTTSEKQHNYALTDIYNNSRRQLIVPNS
jgi:hypothetical protein